MKPSSVVCIIWGLLASCLAAGVSRATEQTPAADLAKALAAGDLGAVRAAVAAGRGALGTRAGEPEVPDRFRRVPTDATRMSREEATRGFVPYLATIESLRWWHTGADPTKPGPDWMSWIPWLIGGAVAVGGAAAVFSGVSGGISRRVAGR
jgi:hypothetical protein